MIFIQCDYKVSRGIKRGSPVLPGLPECSFNKHDIIHNIFNKNAIMSSDVSRGSLYLLMERLHYETLQETLRLSEMTVPITTVTVYKVTL